MLYGLETVSLRKRQESELEVAELKMLRFSLGVTRLDRIRNEYIRGTAHVGRLGDKVREARLRWFGHVNVGHGAARQEAKRKAKEEGSDLAADYAIKFRTLAAQSGWNDAALWAVFCEGLSPALQTELACWEDATSLSQYVATAIHLDNLLCQHRAGACPPVSSYPRPDYPRPCEEAPEPMQLGSLDRATVKLIDRALVEELQIPTIPCMPSLRITAIDSQPIGGGYLTHQTELLDFKVGLFHRERLAFYVTSSPTNPVILGFPWLRQHDPQISWHKGELVRWSATCLSKCLHEPVSRPCLSSVQEVFSRERAAHLLAHRAWGCTIDLLPNTSPPKGQVYPLSLPEARAIEEYIEDALAVGHIRPSTSPAAAGFFFMGKKDRGLRPCIDYRGLNVSQFVIPIHYPWYLRPWSS
ncbi:hypothetical protein QTP70_000808 [Hemibagrus guttatus]|uniref:Uncharacterized protein n=1 Tax=Hemibagrus guttatus TaxID=175788 RepID=A0AAE0V2A6_9TELE|nr:hypothetical protein QTP70_000808 [Hemibagrus guttatus]